MSVFVGFDTYSPFVLQLPHSCALKCQAWGLGGQWGGGAEEGSPPLPLPSLCQQHFSGWIFYQASPAL